MLTWGSCSSWMAAKFWLVSRFSRRSWRLTCAITRFSLAIFFFLLDTVPCTDRIDC